MRGEQQEVRLNWEKRPHHIGLVGGRKDLDFIPVDVRSPGVF